MFRIRALPAVVVLLALGSISVPIAAQAPPPTPPSADSAPAKKVGRFGRFRAKLLPGTTYAGRLISPILTEAQEKGVPGLHVQSAIHEFTGPDGEYPALAEGPANALAERLRKLIREESGQQGRLADSIGTSVNAMMAGVTSAAGPGLSTASGLQLPPDIAGALSSGRLALTNINWAAGDIAVRTALATELKPVAAEMNRLGGQWRVEAAAPAGDGGKGAAELRAVLVHDALVLAGLKTSQGGRGVLQSSKYGQAPVARVEIVRP